MQEFLSPSDENSEELEFLHMTPTGKTQASCPCLSYAMTSIAHTALNHGLKDGLALAGAAP